jgi:periplasmic copper chaperone A
MEMLSTAFERRFMMRWVCALIGVAAAAAAATAQAAPAAPAGYHFESLRIDQPIARATPPGAKTAAVFFTIDNTGNRSERLLRASTPIAAGVVLHQMAQSGGMMTMRAVPSLEIGPGMRLELGPGAYHLMLIDLKQPLRVGEHFPLVLTFERLGTATVMVSVEDLGAAPGAHR